MKPKVVYPDAEKLTKDLLRDLMEDQGEDVTVEIGIPVKWNEKSKSHLQVSRDGAPTATHPIAENVIIRVIARARSTTEAKRLAALAQGLLLAHPGGAGISVFRYLTGVLPARDPATQAELASISVRATVRSNPVPE